ncbi:hypothetical protein BDF19DRAFT_47538 [Syncephalis fuscata]|nr:hypothetical protein BDF19DRAFT_47538 [Syncephalis fuscata]
MENKRDKIFISIRPLIRNMAITPLPIGNNDNDNDNSYDGITTVTASCPSREGYLPENLLQSLQSNLCNDIQQAYQHHTTSWMADTFVRPPVELSFKFRHSVEIMAVVTGTGVGRHTIKSMQLSTRYRHSQSSSSAKSKLASKIMGRIDIPLAVASLEASTSLEPSRSQQDYHSKSVLFNFDPSVLSINNIHEYLPPTSRLVSTTINTPIIVNCPQNRRLFVDQLSLTLLSMYDAAVPSLPFIEIWALPGPEWSLNEWSAACTIYKDSNINHHNHNHNNPERFIDPITHEIMRDPVQLPSGHYCDRYTIFRHLEQYQTNPFTGLSLFIEDIKDATELRQAIAQWRNFVEVAKFIHAGQSRY